MIGVAVALATAQAAVEGIKKAISIGKEAHECLGEFMQLFDTHDQLNRASNEERKAKSDKPQQSVMSEALETVIAARKVQQMTNELREFLIWSGQGDVWDQIQSEHNAIVQRRRATELAAQREAERREKQKRERALIAMVLGIGGIILFNLGRYIWEAWPDGQ